jgi:hypothetical protein
MVIFHAIIVVITIISSMSLSVIFFSKQLNQIIAFFISAPIVYVGIYLNI